MAVTILNREIYSLAEAARLLRVSPVSLKRWLNGYSIKGTTYKPVIREEPHGGSLVTWGEFVEAFYLSGYRDRDVSLQHLRLVIDALRKEFKVPYPLAEFKPQINEKAELMVKIQQDLNLATELCMFHVKDGQTVLAPVAEAFYEKVEFDGDVVARLRPMGAKSTVRVDPEISFGIPQVQGVKTEILAEAYARDDSYETIANDFGLSEKDVESAIRWEIAVRKSA